MYRLGQLLADRRVAAVVVVLTLVLGAVSGWLGQQVRHEDDLLAFLSRDNEDIVRFREINEAFGGIDVALVGVETDDAFDPDVLRRLHGLTEALSVMPELDHVLSLTNVQDFAPDPMGGIQTALLMDALPQSADEVDAFRHKALSREQIAGTLVSHDGTSLVLYAFPAYGQDTRLVANTIQRVAEASFPDHTLHLGGAPFVSAYIYDTTQADMTRLTPWAVLAIVVILLGAFRDLRSVLLGLVSTGTGIGVVYAVMAVLDMPVNVVLGAMPVILFAVGSAYAIHMLARYSVHRQELELEDAVAKTVGHTGPVVLTAGLTTAAGLGSFVMMDITPLRQFGALAALGVGVTLLLSITFVPAVITLARVKPRAVGSGVVGHGLSAEVALIGRHRLSAGFALALVLVFGLVFALRVDSRVDNAAFYDPGSPPDRADRFLRERFGGAQFVQIEVEGDLGDASALRAVRELADRISMVEGVHRVQHVGDVVATVNDAMEGQPRIPDNSAQVGLLYGFLTGNPAVRQLVDQDRARGLMQVRLSANGVDAVERTLQQIEKVVASDGLTAWKVVPVAGDPAAEARRLRMVAHRVQAAVEPYERVTAPQVEKVLAVEPSPPPPAAVAAALADWLGSGEAMVPLEAAAALAVAEAVVGLPDARDEAAVEAAIREATGRAGATLDDAEIGDLVWSVQTPLDEARRDLVAEGRAAALLAALDLAAEDDAAAQKATEDHHRAPLIAALRAAVVDLQLAEVAVPDPAAEPMLRFSVSGTPVLHRGLSESTRRNQWSSLAFALGTVAVLLSVRFRNPLSGLLAAAPTGAALLVVYGGMGAKGIRLDIGTSMLASIVIGAGVDYGVHFLSAWHAREGEPSLAGAVRAAARAGGAIWTNALAVAAGFFVLTLGEARPLKNVGGLTAAAMIVAAGCTFVVLPLLGRRRQYDPAADESDPADPTDLPRLRRTP